jgi:transcriptional regulator with XRE-family HTH domain
MLLRLKFAILGSGSTQRALCAELGMPETRLSAIVHEVVAARPEERQALARLLGHSETELFGSDPPPLTEVHRRGILDGLQSAIAHATALGDDGLVDDLCTVKLNAARRFASDPVGADGSSPTEAP